MMAGIMDDAEAKIPTLAQFIFHNTSTHTFTFLSSPSQKLKIGLTLAAKECWSRLPFWTTHCSELYGTPFALVFLSFHIISFGPAYLVNMQVRLHENAVLTAPYLQSSLHHSTRLPLLCTGQLAKRKISATQTALHSRPVGIHQCRHTKTPTEYSTRQSIYSLYDKP